MREYKVKEKLPASPLLGRLKLVGGSCSISYLLHYRKCMWDLLCVISYPLIKVVPGDDLLWLGLPITICVALDGDEEMT